MTEIIILNMAYWRQASAETESVEKNCYYIQKTMEANNKLRVLMGDHVSDEEIVLPADHFSDFADDEDLPEGVIDLATQRELRGQKNPPDSLW